MTAQLTPPPLRPNFKPEPKLQLNRPPIDWVTLGFFAVFHGVALLAPWFFSWSALGVAILLHWLCGGVGICLGFHRMISHRSFQAPRWLEYSIAFLGTLAMQGGPIFWVSGHRKHHAFTEDIQDDPYSAKRGFWWSHMLWIIYPHRDNFDKTRYSKYAPDLVRQPFYRFLNNYFLLFQVPLALLLYAIGGWSFVVYGVFVRAVFLWHATWLVNSATHTWGYRNFDAKDNARNLWWVSLVTYGEGWHNNHHTFPRAAQTGWKWWEVDVTWYTILLFERLGWAKKVKRIPARR
ncbi:acyl-CoA desaturase [Leptothoe spongobia]|uniref:Fatty acid desaturase n=1 Tax=Leptothoe spongobia TAU-MAC 1115 TaxID=1967444 RepID=A0A947DJ99_9CYAN|nr:fatty acid desaturase [Leptothoe spongobia]MBT9317016.1 fatty acid desaturase [Leptothoe spongobia TAU-MAC 1115]